MMNTREGINMKVQLSPSGRIVVEDVAPENLETVLGILENSHPQSAEIDLVDQKSSPEDNTSNDPRCVTIDEPQSDKLTDGQLERARTTLVNNHEFDYEFVSCLLEDETVTVEAVLNSIIDWEDRLLIIDILVENGWQPSAAEERELRHAAADIVSRGCIRRDGEPLNRYQMIIVGIYACDDHRASDLVKKLDPCYAARVAEEERVVREDAEIDEFEEDVDDDNETDRYHRYLDDEHEVPYLYGDL